MKKVVIGMSGGVDSSVSAYLLKKNGYDVTGLFMRNWDSNLNNDILGNPKMTPICPQEQDYLDAQSVCKTLNIPLLRIDFIKEYWNDVFTYFLTEYEKGRTPNPDILCNKYIKFGYFLKYALNDLQADYIAMGHYARVQFNEQTQEYDLLRGVDHNKDQTYFLCQLNQQQLSRVLFPIGNLEKPAVRRIAEEQNLITADKKDSTGICFIGERNFQDFLQNYIPNQPGNIVDIETGKVLAQHIGVMYYTIGQRKGLNLGGMAQPYFVVGKNVKQNILYVASSSEEKWLYSTSCIVENVNWINEWQADVLECTAKFRYRQKDVPVRITKLAEPNTVLVEYPQGVKAVTPGQEAVFYDGERCLGGGTIDKLFNHEIELDYV